MNCGFTLEHYFDTLEKASAQGYLIEPVKFANRLSKHKRIFLRHDVDMLPEYALKLAIEEHKHNIQSTYYILLRDDYYNPLSKRNVKIMETYRIIATTAPNAKDLPPIPTSSKGRAKSKM